LGLGLFPGPSLFGILYLWISVEQMLAIKNTVLTKPKSVSHVKKHIQIYLKKYNIKNAEKSLLESNRREKYIY
jgi:hypothetical protein